MKKHLRSRNRHSAKQSKAQNYTKASSKKQYRKRLQKKKVDAIATHKLAEAKQQKASFEEQSKTQTQTCEIAADIPENVNLENYMDEIENHIVDLDKKFHQSIESRLKIAGNIEITSEMRKILVKWLTKVSHKFRINGESLHICVQIIDYMLIHKGEIFNKTNFQLLGITSLFISCKYNEIYTLDAQRYVELCDGIYSTSQLFQMQGNILMELNFNLQVPTIYQFINKLVFTLKINAQHQALIKNIVDISIFDFNTLNSYTKHDLAITILCFASKIHKLDSLKDSLLALKYKVCPQIFKKCFISVVTLFKKNQTQLTNISI